jgi:hypothetical protein
MVGRPALDSQPGHAPATELTRAFPDLDPICRCRASRSGTAMAKSPDHQIKGLSTALGFQDNAQPSLLRDEPSSIGDERWDALLAALAEHLAAQHDLAPPDWAEFRVLRRPWFPAELEIQRADALVWAPAAFRKHGVYLSARDLEAA